MKPIITFLVSLLCCLPSAAKEKIYTVENLPKVHLQDKTRYTVNPDNILSAEACMAIDTMLYALERETGIETVVAVVSSIGEADCFDFSHRLLNEWGVGKKGKDNGLVVLLVIDQGCIYFYTGYGLEGVLPDAVCKRIQTQTMLPFLKEKNWDEAMIAGVRSLRARLDGSMANDERDTAKGGGGGGWEMLFILLGIFGVGSALAYCSAYRQSQCPQCGKHELQRSESRLVSESNGIKTEDVIYTCRNCGHRVIRRRQSYNSNYGPRGNRGGGLPPIIGGGGFGRGSGGRFGGFGGGSFGGGRGGGGGAGTRF